MIGLNDKLVDIYKGENKISKVYKGDKLIYPSNLVMWLDGANGIVGNKWIDLSGNNRDIELIGDVSHISGEKSLLFQNQGKGINNNLNLNLENWTISSYMLKTKDINYSLVLNLRRLEDNFYVIFNYFDRNTQFYVKNEGDSQRIFTVESMLNQYVLYDITKKGNEITLYINGVKFETRQILDYPQFNNFDILDIAYYESRGTYIDCKIKSFKIFDKPLNDDEILKKYELESKI